MSKQPQWGRYGLAEEIDHGPDAKKPGIAEPGIAGDLEHNELFGEDESSLNQPWWKTNFFLSQPVLFGTWDGVFTSCMINIFGVIIFLRMGWIVGNAGIGLTVVLIFITVIVALISVASGIGICERCKVESGGVYFLISYVLGGQVGGAVGILYCFGQAVACALFATGFGESIADLLDTDNSWVIRGIALAVMLLLVVINVAGVTWVIKLQLLLVVILLVAETDFIIGSFITTDSGKEHGVVGYSSDVFSNNSGPGYEEGETFFTVFGVFFPTLTGIFAGINMSGDLRNPGKDIPVGTLSALALSTFLYIVNAVILGASCAKASLQTDFMISEKVSALGVLWLAGLYISSMSSCLGAVYGAPRIMQSIANENVIPIIRVLGAGRGANKVPVVALAVMVLVTIIFILIGEVNTLAPIVTMPFIITYAAVDYAYFALAMTFDLQKLRDEKFLAHQIQKDHFANKPRKISSDSNGYQQNDDLDKLFPERAKMKGSSPTQDNDQKHLLEDQKLARKSSSDSATVATPPEIVSKHSSWYSFLLNRWASLFGVIVSVVVIFAVQWGYALANLGVLALIYFYISQVNPGINPGIANEFSFISWVRSLVARCLGEVGSQEQVVVTSMPTGGVSTTAAQLTEDNADFANRGRYHQSTTVKGENYDEYDD